MSKTSPPRIELKHQAICLGLLLLAGCGHLPRTLTAVVNEAVLPDGSRMKLVGVSIGTNHMAPPSLRQRLPYEGRSATFSSVTPTLAYWLEWSGRPAGAPDLIH